MLHNLRVDLAILFYIIGVIITVLPIMLFIKDATFKEAYDEYLKGYYQLEMLRK